MSAIIYRECFVQGLAEINTTELMTKKNHIHPIVMLSSPGESRSLPVPNTESVSRLESPVSSVVALRFILAFLSLSACAFICTSHTASPPGRPFFPNMPSSRVASSARLRRSRTCPSRGLIESAYNRTRVMSVIENRADETSGPRGI